MTKSGYKHIYLKRVFGAVLCNTFIQILFLSIFILVIDINLLHPVTWLNVWYKTFISFKTWLYFLPLCSVICAQGMICSKEYINVPRLQSTRYAALKSIFSFHNVVGAILHIFIGVNIPWIYTSFAWEDFRAFKRVCSASEPDKICLVEERFFLVMGGIWMGFYYFLQFHVLSHRFVSFPIIQRHKLVQVKANFFNTVRAALHYIILPLCIYLILYYFRGGNLRNFVCYMLSVSVSNTPLDSLFELLRFKVIGLLWLFSLIFVVSMKLMELLFNIFLTQRYVFPIFHSSNPSDLILEDGLRAENVPIIYHLAFLDLFLLSDKSQYRRKEIFTLSQPGGHPRIWNSVKSECFNTIEKFTKSFHNALKSPSKEFDLSQSVRTPFVLKTNRSVDLGIQSKIESSTVHRIRRLIPDKQFEDESHNIDGKFVRDANLHNSSHGQRLYQHHDGDFIPEAVVPVVSEWFNRKMTEFQNLAVVNYFFGDIQETHIENLILNSLPVMWAAQSLSLLACSSIDEDNYGVMQNDLSKIIVLLLKLKEVLDSHVKKFGTPKKSPKQNEFVVKMRNSLRASVKRSLYRIAVSFKTFISDIQLPIEAETQMISFIGFRES